MVRAGADGIQRNAGLILTIISGRQRGGELAGLLDTCEQRPLGIRATAMISLLYGRGLRWAELAALDIGDYVKEENEPVARDKGNRQQANPMRHRLQDEQFNPKTATRNEV